MRSKYSFSYNKHISLYMIILIIVSFALIVSTTIAFFYDDDNASNLMGTSGKVIVEAVGEGDEYLSIENTHTSNLKITLDGDYLVAMPGMPIAINANCKVYKSNTSPLLRAKIDFELNNTLTGEVVSDTQILISDLYNQMIDVVADNDWFFHTDGYFYYLGDTVQPEGAENGSLVMKEIDVTEDDAIIHFINQKIKIPERITSDYSGYGVVFTITFQGIQNYVPDDKGQRLDNTIDNSQRIYRSFDDNAYYNDTTHLDYFTISVNENSKYEINPKPGSVLPEVIVLPNKDASGNNITVVGSGFSGNAQIKSITVPSGYTEIEDLSSMTNLKTVDLTKSSITDLDSDTFINTNLYQIYLPSTLQNIGSSCFKGTKLTSISFPSGLKTIGADAFRNVPLTSLFIPASVTSIGNNAFNSPFIVKIVVDDNNENYIDYNDLMLLTKDAKDLKLCASILTSPILEIPSSVETLSEYSLYHCTSTKIYFHEKLSFIADNVFSPIYVEEIEIENTNPNFLVEDGALLSMNKTQFILMLDKDLTEYNIPSTITKIYGSAFAYCDIDTIKISSKVDTIIDTSFMCMDTAKILVDSGNTKFKSDNNIALVDKNNNYVYKFANKSTNTSYTISAKNTYPYSFYNSDNLTSITFSNSVLNIYEFSFAYCDGLNSITLPANINKVLSNAFYSSSINSATIKCDIDDNAFGDCNSLKTIVVESGVELIASFKNCTAIESIEFKGPNPGGLIIGDLFVGVNSEFDIFVPAGSIDLYKSMTQLNKYIEFIKTK